MMSCLLERQKTQFPYILNTMPETLFRLTPLPKSGSQYTSTKLSFPEPLNVKSTSIVLCRYLITKPDLMVHVRANVPGTMVHMAHIPEYGRFGQGQKQENAPSY